MNIEERLSAIEAKGTKSSVERAEYHALRFLDSCNVADTDQTLAYEGKDRWAVWAADALAWTAREIHARRWREAIRGFGQLREYVGRCGGFLPYGLNDQVTALQSAIENALAPLQTRATV